MPLSANLGTRADRQSLPSLHTRGSHAWKDPPLSPALHRGRCVGKEAQAVLRELGALPFGLCLQRWGSAFGATVPLGSTHTRPREPPSALLPAHDSRAKCEVGPRRTLPLRRATLGARLGKDGLCGCGSNSPSHPYSQSSPGKRGGQMPSFPGVRQCWEGGNPWSQLCCGHASKSHRL